MAREIVTPVAGHPAPPLRLERAMECRHETHASSMRRILDLVGPERNETRKLFEAGSLASDLLF